ncbi:MAG: TRAP transporter substrate-binding protein [SAR324 cluster bacterium]|nr:TRAP transporter substrate-binding protein [SAR324 cluster bacterium]
MRRRTFLTALGVGAAATAITGLISSCEKKESEVGGPAVIIRGKTEFEWRMVTTWPPHFPVFGEAAERIAANVERMSAGRIKIKVYGGGELVPPLGTFDAVRQGTVECGHSAAYYWAGTSPATQFFAAVPFGMNAQQSTAWLMAGGGQELWDELYAQFNLKPFPAGNTGVQMAGWFRKEIKSMDDLKGLKMRIPGLGGKVLAKVGGTVVLLAASEVFPALERGVIDAAEWVGPYHDMRLGLHQAAKNYYYPGWHEPGTVLELIIAKEKWEALPDELQAIFEAAAAEAHVWTLSELEAKNAGALKDLVQNHGVKVRPLPDDVLRALKRASEETVAEVARQDPFSGKVYDSFSKFKKENDLWQDISERAYQRALTL